LTLYTLIKRSEYYDSVSLMLVARDLSRLPGVEDAAVVMATEANKSILRAAGLYDPDLDSATPNDLVIAFRVAGNITGDPLEVAEHLLKSSQRRTALDTSSIESTQPLNLRGALRANPQANVAVISITGRYAAAEAMAALRKGLHVLLFSDNVSLEDEISLKQYASEHGLLLMGPGAGTAILNGVALGFANILPPGPVGIVSAAGTGLQEVSTLLAHYGVGITQGIGTGGRDLKEEVGGLMMLAGLKALQQDPATQVVVLISKPPSLAIVQRVLDQVSLSEKPVVACFLGAEISYFFSNIQPINLRIVPTLEQAAWHAASLARTITDQTPPWTEDLSLKAADLRNKLRPGQRYLRGLYSGGTLCYEAQVILRDLLDEPFYTNAPLDERYTLTDSTHSQRNTLVDLGEEEFTVGRLHPMIDNAYRIRRLHQEASDPEVAVILLDVVLGFGAHPDPSSELATAIQLAQSQTSDQERQLIFIASVTGTEQDPQSWNRQVTKLQDAGVVVCASNAQATRLAGTVIAGVEA
jgi:FdrA protein